MTATTKGGIFLLACVSLCTSSAVLANNGGTDTRVIHCDRGQSIQRQIDRRNPDRNLTLIIRGTCTENVTIDRDDLTLVGESGTVVGTISIPGSRRVVIRTLTVTGPGEGVVATENASVTIEDSFLDGNELDGAVVRNGANAFIRRTSLSNNGHLATVPDRGRGLDVRHGGTADARNSTVLNNRSDGIGVYNNSYARLVANTIEGNGRTAANESGIQVSRSRVRADANIIRNNTGISALQVVNDGNYRTGSSLNTADFPDGEFPFEIIEHPVGVVDGVARLALDVANGSNGDFRQVHIRGSIQVGRQSMVQIRGDDLGPNRTCSTVDYTGGFFQVTGRNGYLRLVFTNVTPPAVAVGTPNGQFEGTPVCVVGP
jgi:hypothetical protein